MLSKPLFRQLDSENVNSNGKSTIDNLLKYIWALGICPICCVSGAIALGNTGLHGTENPPAMTFYATALRFWTILKQHDCDTSGAVQRNKRWWPTYCDNSDSYCYSSCPIGPNCSGLCGPGCDCWWFVCFNCCYNIGCYLHDAYGCPDGRGSLLALSLLYAFYFVHYSILQFLKICPVILSNYSLSKTCYSH